MATICMSYNFILYRANYFVLREHFVFNVLCRTCRHLCAGFSEGVVLTSEFDFDTFDMFDTFDVFVTFDFDTLSYQCVVHLRTLITVSQIILVRFSVLYY